MNLSRTGVLITLDANGYQDVPPVGQLISVDIDLPPNPLYEPKCLQCRGVVVRTFSARGHRHQIAVEILQLRFRKAPPVWVKAGKVVSLERTNGAPMVTRRKQSGNAFVEICFLMPWIFLLFMAVFDVGFYSYAAISTANAARVAALYAASDATAAVDSATACSIVLKELNSLPLMGGATCAAGCAAGSECSDTRGRVTVQATRLKDIYGAAVAKVSVSYTTPTLFKLPWINNYLKITRSVQARQRT